LKYDEKQDLAKPCSLKISW